MSLLKSIVGALAVGAVLCVAPTCTARQRSDDATFLQLRDAASADNGAEDEVEIEAYAARLTNYDIVSYVDYYQLKARLRTATAEQVRDFLTRYEGSAIADRMRNDWLLDLGYKRDWANFDQQLPKFVHNDDIQVKCYALLSRAVKGKKVADDARELLQRPSGYGAPCASLIATLAQSGQFDVNDLLVQLRLAGEANASGQIKRIAALLKVSEARAAQALTLPALTLARGVGRGRAEHEVFLVALGRMARTSHTLAAAALRRNLSKLSVQEQAIGWASVALPASYVLAGEGHDYWRKSAGAPLSRDAMQWKVRYALRRGDWGAVRAGIGAMPQRLRDEPTWIYWLARATQAQDPDGALALYRSIADQTHFYGQLALEELGQQISIPSAGAPISAAELALIAADPGLRRALRLFGMRLRFEGTREWNWALRKFSDREHLVAAEFARQNDILDRMINTSDRTRTEFDYTQRFPSPHDDILQPVAHGLGLDRAWVYGLIRQESRFITDARSPVGASGLMQVMPSTGYYVAKKIGMAGFAQSMLADLRTNITLGVNYLNLVLANVGGSQTVATAAYNAGLGRLRAWRASLTGPMEGAIFAESIPFNETRTYVKNVMSNATNYAALFENRPQSLKARLGQVQPNGS